VIDYFTSSTIGVAFIGTFFSLIGFIVDFLDKLISVFEGIEA